MPPKRSYPTQDYQGANKKRSTYPPKRQQNDSGTFENGQWYCNCQPRREALKFKAGPKTKHPGQEFWTCETRKEDGGCGFYLWADQAERRAASTFMNQNKQAFRSSEDLHCNCDGAPLAKHDQVRTQSANHGRWYSACKKGKKDVGGCGFFKWDEAEAGRADSVEHSPVQDKPMSGEVPHCKCPDKPLAVPKKSRTTKNPNRWFYGCKKMASEGGCGFFEWNEGAEAEALRIGSSQATSGSPTNELASQKLFDGPQERGEAVGGLFGRVETVNKGLESEVHPGDESTESEPELDSPSTRKQHKNNPVLPSGTAAHKHPQAAPQAAVNVPPETPRKIPDAMAYQTPDATTVGKRKLPWEVTDMATKQAKIQPMALGAYRVQDVTTMDPSAFALPKIIDDPFASTTITAKPVVGNPTTLAKSLLVNPVTPKNAPPPAALLGNAPIPPARHVDALNAPAKGASEIVPAVESVLKTDNVRPETQRKVLSILNQHELKAQGVRKARDMNRDLASKYRDTIAERDASIKELQAEIERLKRGHGRRF